MLSVKELAEEKYLLKRPWNSLCKNMWALISSVNWVALNFDILELFKGLVVQVQTWVSGQIKLLKLGRQILWQCDLTQFITAQIYTLTKERKRSEYKKNLVMRSGAHTYTLNRHTQRFAVTTVLLSSPSAAWPQERPRWSWSGRWACAFAGNSWWWWAQSSACFRSGPPPPAPPTWPFYWRVRREHYEILESIDLWTLEKTGNSSSATGLVVCLTHIFLCMIWN